MKRAWASIVLFSTLLTPRMAAAQSDDSLALNAQDGRVDFAVFAKLLFTMKKEGRFKQFTGQLSYDPSHPGDTRVDLTVYTASVDMSNPDHAAMLKSGDFFDVDRFPTMHFVSAATQIRPDGTVSLVGDLTIRDVTRRIEVPVKIGAKSFETTFQIDRTEFGLNGSPSWSGMNVSISKNVEIHIAIGGIRGARPTP